MNLLEWDRLHPRQALTGFPHRVDKRNVATGDLSGIGCEKDDILPKPRGRNSSGMGQVLKVL